MPQTSVGGLTGNLTISDLDGLGFASDMEVSAARPGNRVVCLGDSTTSNGLGQQDLVHGIGYPTYLGIQSSQRAWMVRNAGKFGDRTDQILARFDTDVTPYAPNTVVILAGTNDVGQSIALSTITTNLLAIIAKCKLIGAKPILCTIPPNSTGAPADRKARIIALNGWITRYGAQNGITVLDFYGLLTDPANGNYLSAYDGGDGTHPNAAGYAAMGALAATTLGPLLPAWAPQLPAWQDDSQNLVPDGLFLNATSGFPTSPWVKGGSYTGVTTSMVTGDTTIKGSWHRLTWAAASTSAPLPFVTVATAPVAGHVYAFMGRIATSGIAGSGVLHGVKMRFSGGSTVDYGAVSALDNDVNGIFYIEGVAAAANTAIQVQANFTVPGGGWTSGGYWQWAQVGIYDLTAMGIAPAFPMGPTP